MPTWKPARPQQLIKKLLADESHAEGRLDRHAVDQRCRARSHLPGPGLDADQARPVRAREDQALPRSTYLSGPPCAGDFPAPAAETPRWHARRRLPWRVNPATLARSLKPLSPCDAWHCCCPKINCRGPAMKNRCEVDHRTGEAALSLLGQFAEYPCVACFQEL